MAVLALLTVCFSTANSQIIDEVIGQRRIRVQAMLKPYRILDYKQEREVHNIESGIHQTVLFENDTCKRFYWAVTPSSMERFKSLLSENGYKPEGTGFVKDSLNLLARELNSGKATLFIASISAELKGNRDASGRIIVKKKKSEGTVDEDYIPLLQKAIMEEELRAKNDTTPKKKKDPRRHWVGGSSGETSILGWEE